MAFTVLNTIALESFTRKHRDAKKPLADWLHTVLHADWQSHTDLRRAYPSADGVNVKVSGGGVIVVTVFNIKGNEYRLITIIHYKMAVCRVVDVLTHAEYTKDRWKDRI